MTGIVTRERDSKNKGGNSIKSFLERVHRESKAFTMVELLMVIAILGVLAAVGH